MVRLGDIWKRRGNTKKASQFWHAAKPLFERSSQLDDAVQCEERLQESLPEDSKAVEAEIAQKPEQEELNEAQFPEVPDNTPGKAVHETCADMV